MKTTLFALLFALLGSFAAPCAAALLEREVSFSESEIQKSLLKNGPQTKNYGWMTVTLSDPPRISVGTPEGRIGLAARIHVAVLGGAPIPVDVTGTAGIRYDDNSKAFFLENPVVQSVESQAIPKEAQPSARQAANTLINNYFRNRPVYQLREDGTPQEIAARWLLRSVRIEPGRLVATLSPL
ncbi:MAG: DUF1439 domain-containing protein [Rhodocyclales bacterium GT-UBC]|nr:MAG: DUF1439 domain-containing protein [Rhodocyclales bacterium GT-UBC]